MENFWQLSVGGGVILLQKTVVNFM